MNADRGNHPVAFKHYRRTFGIVLFAVIAALIVVATVGETDQKEIQIMTLAQNINAEQPGTPPIDATRPANVETATFALG